MRLKDTTFNRIALTIFVLVSVAVFSSQAFATTLPGAVLGSKITVGDTANTYAIADTNYLQGGHMQVSDRDALCAITRERRSTGMLVTVRDDATDTTCGTGSGGTNVTYRLTSNPTTDGTNGTATPTTASNWRIVIPDAASGYNGGSNKYLTADSSGNLTWGTVSGGGGGGSSYTFSTGLTESSGTVTVNTTQNIAKLSNLTGNGFVKTSGSDGTLSIDTNTYLTGNQSITLSGDISGSGTTSITTTIGAGKVTNSMLAGSIDASKLVGTDITTVGTVSSGTWNGSVISGAYGGTGVNNSGKTITLTGNLTFTGGGSVSFDTSGPTNLVLPTAGQLATTGGFESLTNKKLGSLTSNGFVKTSGGDGTLSVDTNTYLNASNNLSDITNASTARTNLGLSSLATATTVPLANGGTGTSTAFTQGSLVFAGTSGLYNQNNSKIFWDDTNYRLGVGTNSPQAGIHIASGSNFQMVLERTKAGTYGGGNSGNARFAMGIDGLGNAAVELQRGKSGFSQSTSIYWDWAWADDADNDFRFIMNDANRYDVIGSSSSKQYTFSSIKVGIGDSNPSELFSVGSNGLFQVNSSGDLIKINNVAYAWPGLQAGGSGYVLSNDGTGALSWVSPGAATVAVGSAVTSATAGSIFFADGFTNLAQDNNHLFWDQGNNYLGVGTSTPQAPLHVTGTSGNPLYAGIMVTGGSNIVLGGNGGNSPSIVLYPNIANTGEYAGNYYNATDDAYYLQTVGLSSSDIVLRNFSTGKSFTMNENGLLTIENIDSINGVHYSWTSSQGNLGDVLINDGSGNLSWSAPSLSLGSSVFNIPINSMLFTDGSGLLGYDNNFVWDNNNKRLGIGTFSPSSALSVGNNNEFQVNSTGDIVSINGITYSWPSAGAVNIGDVLSSNNGTLSWAPAVQIGYPVSNGVSGSVLYVDSNNQLAQNSSVLFFDGNNLGIGTNSPQALLDVNGNAVFGGNVTMNSLTPTNGIGDALCIDTVTNVLSRDGSGACAVSSQRFKHDIVSLPFSALDTVNQLRTVNFKYNGTDKVRTGFIAEEVEKVNKDYVVYEADGVTPHGVYYIDMIPLVAKAVQEIDLKIKGVASLDLTNPISVGSLIKQFLADQSNNIEIIFAKVIHTDKVETKELCVGTTCITEAEFIEMIQNKSSNNSSVNNSVNNLNQNSDSNTNDTIPVDSINNNTEDTSSVTPSMSEVGGEGASSDLNG